MKLKRLSYLLLILIFSGSISAKTIKVLAIGNSFSMDAIEQYLYELAEASGDDIIIGNMYIGGAELALHYKHSQSGEAAYAYRKIVDGKKTDAKDFDLRRAIRDEDWDYISLQQVSSKSGQYESFFPYVFSLMDYVRAHATNAKVKFILHATWAYAQDTSHKGFFDYRNNQDYMYECIVDATRQVYKTAKFDILIPTGTAIQNGRTSVLGDTFCRDGYHLEYTYGRFTAACTWYQVLFKKSVMKNPYKPETITDEQATIAKYAAYYAAKKPYKITRVPHK